jgi:hypothetical protein
MDFQTLAESQVRDAVLLQQVQAKPLQVQRKLFAPGIHVYCHISTPGGPWKVILPGTLLRNLVLTESSRFRALRHLSVSRHPQDALSPPKLQQVCEDEVGRCDQCQRHKNAGRGHGETASREAPLLPWQDVAVDLIGAWTLSIGDQNFRFSALTMIDMVTNLVEAVH